MNMDNLSALLLSKYAGLHSQMTACEQMVVQQILAELRPQHAVEIGTYKGGSLQVLAHFSKRVNSIDIDPAIPNSIGHLFANVTFHTGNSADLLPSVLLSAALINEHTDFVLIDGDHSTEGVRRDINALLSVTPSCEMIVLMHDSFNPECRAGIISANWALSPYVHEVEIDFIPGIYHERAFDTAAARTMWGGFARAILKPVEREEPLVILQSQKGLFDAVYRVSSHRQKPFLTRVMRAGLRRLNFRIV